MITLKEIKEYLRIDYDDDDNFLLLCMQNAEGYLKDCIEDYETKILNDRFSNKAKLIILMIISNMVDERSFVCEDKEEYRLIVSGFILQMKYSTYN